MDQIKLKDNHRRAVSVTCLLIEKSIDEMEKILQHPANENLYKLEIDLPEKKIKETLEIIVNIKKNIHYLNKKYDLNHEVLMMSRVLEAKKTKIWEYLCDTTSSKLKGYGDFPEEYAEEFDNDINTLLKLSEKL